MSDDVDRCEDNVEIDQYHRTRREWDCNSSSGGSVYQEFHGRQEDTMYSTDDEFQDATETIRSPLLSEDPEQQLSSPVLKQLRQEKEQTRYIVVDMLTDSESVNNMEHCKQNFETAPKHSSGENVPDSSKRDPYHNVSSEEITNKITEPSGQQNSLGCKLEKNKCSRTLRLPSTVTMPTVKSDRPARGDGRPPVGMSKIPLPVSSMTKLQQINATLEQNSSESESCPLKFRKQSGTLKKSNVLPESPEKDTKLEDDQVPQCLNENVSLKPEPNGSRNSSQLPTRSYGKPSSKQSSRPPSRAINRTSSLKKEDKADTGDENMNSQDKYSTKEETHQKTKEEAPEKLVISNDEEPRSHEKPRTKRARSQIKSIEDEHDALTRMETDQVSPLNLRAENKRIRIANKLSSREEPEKHYVKPTEPAPKDPEKRKREIQAVRHRLAKDRLNLINSREKDEVNRKQSQGGIDSTAELKTHDPLKLENTKKSASRKSDNGTSQAEGIAQASSSNASTEKNIISLEKVSRSPRQLSPMVMNMSIVEKRRQLRQSREAANGDQKLNTKNVNMPEIKPALFKSNQLKTNQLGLRHQDNLPNAPMKSALEDESLKKKTTLIEKRKILMKQKEAATNKPSLLANQKRSNTDIQKRSAATTKSAEKSVSLHSNFTMQDVQEEFGEADAQAKPSTTSTNSKATLASMQNVYKMHLKRCEDQLSEVKRAKEKLGLGLEKLEALRNQMIQKFGEDAEEFVPPLCVVQSAVHQSPTVMTTAKGMNTEALEEIAESNDLLRNNQQLKLDIENLKIQLEEAKEMGLANKKEDELIQDLKQRILDTSLTLKLTEKRQQALEDKMEEKQREIISLTDENKQMNDLFRQKDQQLSALRKQVEEKSRELESVHKKLNEADSRLQGELYKSELIRNEHEKLIEEKKGMERKLREMDAKFANFEEREECFNTILENEKKKNKQLEEVLTKKDEELSSMEKKIFEMETSTDNMLAVTDQLQEKEIMIQKLEIMKKKLQDQIRELCFILHDIFALRGIEYNTDNVQDYLTAGSFSKLREELLKLMEGRIEEGNKALNEARSKIVELQNQVKILQIELEDSKMMSERLTNVVSQQKSWDADKPWDEHQRPWSSDMVSARPAVHNNVVENSLRDNKSFRDGDVHSLIPSINNSFVCSEAAMARNNFNELFVLLERKRRQLLQLERKYQDMEEVHSHCAQKRTRNETRIAQLEMMLAELENQGAAKRRNIIYLSDDLELLYKGVNVKQLEIIFDDI